MVFTGLVFLFRFLPVALLAYYAAPKKLRNGVLLVLSLIFYAWGESVYIFLMIFSTVYDYVNGLLIDKFRRRKAVAKAVLIISLVGNGAILGFFKYAEFVVENVIWLSHLGNYVAGPIIKIERHVLKSKGPFILFAVSQEVERMERAFDEALK